MNPSSVIENGQKTRFYPELEVMVFLLTHLCKMQPVSSRIFVKELKKARWFSFRGKSNKEAAPAYTFGFVVAQTIKQLLKTKRNRQPLLACTWIHSPENDRGNQKVSSASAGRGQPRRAPNQDNAASQDDGTKLSHKINLLFIL